MLRRQDQILLVVDVQERLAPVILEGEQIVERCLLLVQVAQRLSVPILVSEQYPKGLGRTLAVLNDRLADTPRLAKTAFSCAEDEGIRAAVQAAGRRGVVICGMEAHVCVLQSALGFAEAGWQVAVVADAVGSRRASSKSLGLARMQAHGIEIVDSEMVAFEWLQRAGTDEFRAIAPLLR